MIILVLFDFNNLISLTQNLPILISIFDNSRTWSLELEATEPKRIYLLAPYWIKLDFTYLVSEASNYSICLVNFHLYLHDCVNQEDDAKENKTCWRCWPWTVSFHKGTVLFKLKPLLLSLHILRWLVIIIEPRQASFLP